eukprot:2840256-Prymnesium_polylepis.1
MILATTGNLATLRESQDLLEIGMNATPFAFPPGRVSRVARGTRESLSALSVCSLGSRLVAL